MIAIRAFTNNVKTNIDFAVRKKNTDDIDLFLI